MFLKITYYKLNVTLWFVFQGRMSSEVEKMKKELLLVKEQVAQVRFLAQDLFPMR